MDSESGQKRNMDYAIRASSNLSSTLCVSGVTLGSDCVSLELLTGSTARGLMGQEEAGQVIYAIFFYLHLLSEANTFWQCPGNSDVSSWLCILYARLHS